MFEAGKRFTQAQGLFNASLFVLLIASPVNTLLNHLFVFILEWDLDGTCSSNRTHAQLTPSLAVGVYLLHQPERAGVLAWIHTRYAQELGSHGKTPCSWDHHG
jgi:Na+-driven multidrug efflux pump